MASKNSKICKHVKDKSIEMICSHEAHQYDAPKKVILGL